MTKNLAWDCVGKHETGSELPHKCFTNVTSSESMSLFKGFRFLDEFYMKPITKVTDLLLAVCWKQNCASSNSLTTRKRCDSLTVQGTQIGLAFVSNRKREGGIKIVIPTLKLTCLFRLCISLPTRPDNQLQATRWRVDSLLYYFWQKNWKKRGSG